jgi:23S rRNA U2552 (ribose-2'-O)-methylase RlmE/FtsJ
MHVTVYHFEYDLSNVPIMRLNGNIPIQLTQNGPVTLISKNEMDNLYQNMKKYIDIFFEPIWMQSGIPCYIIAQNQLANNTIYATPYKWETSLQYMMRIKQMRHSIWTKWLWHKEVPIQNIDMKRSSDIRFTTVAAINAWLANNQKVRDLFTRYGIQTDTFFHTSVIDILRTDSDTGYIYTTESNMDWTTLEGFAETGAPHTLMEHLQQDVNPILSGDNIPDVLFIPVGYTNTPINHAAMSNVNGVTIVDQQAFTKHISNMVGHANIDMKQKGKPILSVGSLEYVVLSKLQKYVEMNETRKKLAANGSKGLYDLEWRNAWNLKPDELDAYFRARDKTLKEYLAMSKMDTNNCKKMLTKYFDKFNDIQFTETNPELTMVRKCYFDRYHYDETYAQYEPGNNIVNCRNYKLAPIRTADRIINMTCKKSGNMIMAESMKKTPELRKFLTTRITPTTTKILSPDVTPTTIPEAIPDIYNPQKNVIVYPDFQFFPEYIPEWVDNMVSGDLKKIVQQRQMLLGDYDPLLFFKNCNMIYQSLPVINFEPFMDYITWSLITNKVYIICQMAEPMIFPVRSIFKRQDTNILFPRRRIFNPTWKHRLLGTIVINVTDNIRFNKKTHYILHLYFEDPTELADIRNRIAIYNFRGNEVIAGTTFAFQKVLHIELNVLYYHNDPGINNGLNLYRYKHDRPDTYNIFATLMTKQQIVERLRMYHMNDACIAEWFANLIPCRLTKREHTDEWSIMDIIDSKPALVMQGGGKIESDIQYGDGLGSLYDDTIVPSQMVETMSRVYNLFDPYIYLSNYIVQNYIVSDANAIYKSVYVSRDKEQYNMTTDLQKVVDEWVPKKLPKAVLTYRFVDRLGMMMYDILSRYWNPRMKKMLVISAYEMFLDGAIYLMKYKQMRKISDITFCSVRGGRPEKLVAKCDAYLKKNNVTNFIPIVDHLTNQTLHKFADDSSIAKFDFVISNQRQSTWCMNNKDTPCIYATNHNAYTFVQNCILGLSHLNEGGTLIIVGLFITRKCTLDVLVYLSQYFEKIKIDCVSNRGQTYIDGVYVCKNYLGHAKIDLLYQINESFDGKYIIDPHHILTNVIKPIQTKLYDKHKAICARVFYEHLIGIEYMLQLEKHINDTQFIENELDTITYNLLYWFQSIGLSISEWIDMPQLYQHIILTKFKWIEPVSMVKLQSVEPSVTKIKPSDECELAYDFTKTVMMSELIYQYLDTYDLDNYKRIELDINNTQKKLNRVLQRKYNIQIGTQPVSRAWLKMYSILHETHILDKQDTMKLFFICEAPGNFINAINYYAKTFTKLSEIEWHAQSLVNSDISDEYGFISATSDHWDAGITKSGDITEFANVKYYMSKYGKVDGLIGDCGESWTAKEVTGTHVNLGYYELIYCLLMPKVGGFCVIKTYLANTSKNYLAALQMVCSKYKKVYLFKSNINMWSSEVYIVGKDFKGLTDEERAGVLECVKTGKCLIDKVSLDFIKEYDTHVMRMISDNIEIKKFMVMISTNTQLYRNYQDAMMDSVRGKTMEFAKKYFAHLSDLPQSL